MAIAFTPEQEKVIELRNKNILVSAAAGSGKTAVLVERIVRMVCDETHPVDIDRLLIVTFTSAAAAEMRERIDKGIAEQLKLHPESEHIQKQSTLLHNAQITTIDSFCLFVVRNHFHEIGLDPAFRVADENEIKLLKKDVLDELLEEQFAKGEQSFLDCVEFFCPGGKESVLEEYIMHLSRHASSCPFPEKWLENRKKDYHLNSEDTVLNELESAYLMHYLQSAIAGLIRDMERIKRICEQSDGPYMYGEAIEKDLAAFDALQTANTYERYAELLPAVSFVTLSRKSDDSVNADKRELVKKMRDEIKKKHKKLVTDFFGKSLETLKKQAIVCEKMIEILIDLTLAFDQRVLEKKAEKKLIDFADMEHFALRILLDVDGGNVKPSKIAREYKEHFYEILIDEYQDSNLTQEALLQAISGEDLGNYNRFMVGDIKQSIYGFRQARPDLFLEKYNLYQPDGEKCCRIDLSKNYRSRSQVVDTTNGIFARIMRKEIGGIEYDDNAKLYAMAEYVPSVGNESELLVVEKPATTDELNGKQAEAKAIALRIKELKKSFRVMDKESKTLRPVQYSDMVILLRTNRGWDEEFKKVLEQEGIPVYITSKTGYFEAKEIQDLLQVLRVIDNPKQDIPLYGMLTSVFGNFSEEEIAKLRGGKKDVCLYDALCTSEDEKVTHFLEKLNKYRAYTVYMPIRELLQRLVSDHDYLNYVTALPAGSKRRANVEMLFTKASDFEKTSYFGLFHFVRYMEQLEKYEVDYGEADMLDENADVVRIMSIHKSKGLEFPVVFVAGLTKEFNKRDFSNALIMDTDMGLGVTYVDLQFRTKQKTLRQQLVAQKMLEDFLAEELRVFYVALTRAREKLILTATIADAEKEIASARSNASELLEYMDFIGAASYWDFLQPILANTDLEIKTVGCEELVLEELNDQVKLQDRQVQLQKLLWEQDNESQVEALKKRLSYEYPYKNLERLYSKTSVSELKAEAMLETDEVAHEAFELREKEPYVPSFVKGEKETPGVLRGSAFHRAMELLDFDKTLKCLFNGLPESYEQYAEAVKTGKGKVFREVENFLAEEKASKRLKEEYFDAINPWKIVGFLQSECAMRMWFAQLNNKLYREQPFVMGVDATELPTRFDGDAPEGETVLVQGIIDVFWEENGKIMLLDYKTDRVDGTEELWNRYAAQLQIYSRAIQQIVGLEVSEQIIYSSCLECESKN